MRPRARTDRAYTSFSLFGVRIPYLDDEIYKGNTGSWRSPTLPIGLIVEIDSKASQLL